MIDLSGRPLLATKADLSLFVDRRRELQETAGFLAMRTNVLLLGGRGSGRTSFLHRLQADLSDDGWRVIFVEGALAETPLEFLSLLRYRISPEFEAPPLATQIATVAKVATSTLYSPSVRRRPLEDAPGESELMLDLITEIARLLRGTSDQTVILVDEIPSPDVSHALFGRLRDELWQLPASWVVTANTSDKARYLRPPADAFFPHVVMLRGLERDTSVELLQVRLGPRALPKYTLIELASQSRGNPRRLLSLAREALSGTAVHELRARADRREREIAQLDEPARRLVLEIEANGPVSASDPALLERLGWSRSRAAQVLAALERSGIVSGSTERQAGRRPRKIYSLRDADLASD